MCAYSGEEETGFYTMGLYLSKLICPVPKDI